MHQVGVHPTHGFSGGLTVNQVELEQMVALCRCRAKTGKFRLYPPQIAGVAKLVEVEHLDIRITQQPPHHSPTNEASPPVTNTLRRPDGRADGSSVIGPRP